MVWIFSLRFYRANDRPLSGVFKTHCNLRIEISISMTDDKLILIMTRKGTCPGRPAKSARASKVRAEEPAIRLLRTRRSSLTTAPSSSFNCSTVLLPNLLYLPLPPSTLFLPTLLLQLPFLASDNNTQTTVGSVSKGKSVAFKRDHRSSVLRVTASLWRHPSHAPSSQPTFGQLTKPALTGRDSISW